MRIAHLSDLHCSGTKRNRKALARLFADVNATSPDHIVVSGDMSNTGDPLAFEALNDLFTSVGWTTPEKLTVVPGNHDLFPELFAEMDWEAAADGVSLGELPGLVAQIIPILIRFANYESRDYQRSLKRFVKVFGRYFEGMVGVEGTALPAVKHLDEEVALLCIDTNRVFPTVRGSLGSLMASAGRMIFEESEWYEEFYRYSDNPFCSNGGVNLEALDSAIGAGALRNRTVLAVCHHYLYSRSVIRRHSDPFFARSMEIRPDDRSGLLERLLRARARLVLHGHSHFSEQYRVRGLRALCAGATLEGEWFEISVNRGSVRTTPHL